MQFKGFWNTPGDVQTKHFGELSINKFNRIELEMHSSYSESELPTKVHTNFNTLFGTANDGTKITLISPFSTKGTGNFVYKRILKFNYCLIGEHRKLKEEEFKVYRLEYSNIWGMFSTLTMGIHSAHQRKSVNKIIATTDKFELSIKVGIKNSSSSVSMDLPTTK